MVMPSSMIKGAARSAEEAEASKDAKLEAPLKKMQSSTLSRQAEGMHQTAGEQDFEQAWKDVRSARSKSAEASRSARQKRFSGRQ